MATGLAGKSAVVLSDNDKLFRAIELNLKRYLGIEVVKLAPSTPGQQGSQAEVGDFDLIVVAMSSLTSEPVVALARAALTREIGRVPLLIISERPFRADPDNKIVHLDFPFDIDDLHYKVREILEK
jgi:hypothetical protein